MKIIRYITTPNPNALKCMTDAPIPRPATPRSPRSYTTLDAAADDPFALALLKVSGVTGVLIADDWFTVNRSPDSAWKSIKSDVESAIARVTSTPSDAGADPGHTMPA
jgi:Scaffold protein Nfu/NifU N terminal